MVLSARRSGQDSNGDVSQEGKGIDGEEMKDVISFRIYPESVYSFYFDVMIHPTLRAMRKSARKNGGKRSNFNDAQAVTCGYRRGEWGDGDRIHWKKCCGLLLFHRKGINAETLSHEATHAAIRWMEEKKFSFPINPPALISERGGMASDDEERFCYAVGRMTNQIAVVCSKHDLFPK
jgi:hypothetical protein